MPIRIKTTKRRGRKREVPAMNQPLLSLMRSLVEHLHLTGPADVLQVFDGIRQRVTSGWAGLWPFWSSLKTARHL